MPSRPSRLSQVTSVNDRSSSVPVQKKTRQEDEKPMCEEREGSEDSQATIIADDDGSEETVVGKDVASGSEVLRAAEALVAISREAWGAVGEGTASSRGITTVSPPILTPLSCSSLRTFVPLSSLTPTTPWSITPPSPIIPSEQVGLFMHFLGADRVSENEDGDVGHTERKRKGIWGFYVWVREKEWRLE
jgi:hypothetical protein